jgi:phospholipid/cholesterol/gamma-HCH transport system ATP-binding protein
VEELEHRVVAAVHQLVDRADRRDAAVREHDRAVGSGADALELVGIADLARRMPANVSGGQRKRAALARASILDPEIIFADEPTAGLDPVVAAEVDNTLVQFRDTLGSTIVVVSHELASIRATADRAVMLANGGVAAEGTLDELVQSQNESVYEFFHARNA